MDVLSIALPVAATLLVAALAFFQWARTEKRQASNERATRQALEMEQRGTLEAPFREQRTAALQALIDKLKQYELNSRWNTGGQDLRAEIPVLNTFLIQKRALLREDELELARQFLEGLTWIDHHEEQRRESWRAYRQSRIDSGHADPGDYESTWADTGVSDIPIEEMWEAARKWQSAGEELEARLRSVLQGKDVFP
ncbi:hypothetical protein ACIBCM_27075 [Streptomyces sp. NPDC051018]|uniref:hypothetical protein n=1 Tax=Streptomyces sp. NPDC051018 TaxID=3365639 RepID=UPI00378D8615